MAVRRFALVLALCLAALSSLHGCNNAPKTSDVDIATIQYDELMALLARPGDSPKEGLLGIFDGGEYGKAVLVDVRKAEKFAAGHIPGAVNIPLPELDRHNPKLAEATAIIVYASGWTDYLSAAGAKKLMALGYQNVYEFRGGLELWQSEGGRVEGDVQEKS